ncbi:MAG TPA: hypothetical protein VK712_03530 [Verrucomicrobiae bacterium]|jgi:hypothetical protein|nr:hypothetical protein [Verrucomicrobiae bacterium]
MIGEPFLSRDDQHEFADRLATLEQDPVNTLAVLSDGLQLPNLHERLSLSHELTPQSADELGEGALKTINVLRRLVMLFSRHGIVGTQVQGLWLIEPNKELWIEDEMKTPLEVLVLGAQEIGPTKDNIWRIVSASQTFLRPGPDDQGITEAWDIVDSGAGELTIPLHNHGDED